MLARKRGGVTPIESHPTSAIWVRYRGVKDMDGVEVVGTDPGDPFARAVMASRRLATNHFTGWGYWIWFIPLKDGETSVGSRLGPAPASIPAGRRRSRGSQRFLDGNPLTRELLERATPIGGDCRYYGHLPYFVDTVHRPGVDVRRGRGGIPRPLLFAGAGPDGFFGPHPRRDRAARSPGLRPGRWRRRTRSTTASYARFFHYFYESIYRDKYYVMGDYDTMTASFLLDTALYYAAAVMPIYRWNTDRLGIRRSSRTARRSASTPSASTTAGSLRSRSGKRRSGSTETTTRGGGPASWGSPCAARSWVMLAHGVVRWWKAELANAWTYVVRPRPLAKTDREPSLGEPMRDSAGEQRQATS